jgi:hypothetical protein
MDPTFKTDLWAVTNAASGFEVVLQLRRHPASPRTFVTRLKDAAEYLGIDRISIFYDERSDLFVVGTGRVRISQSAPSLTDIVINEFPEDDYSDLVEGRPIFEHAQDMLDFVDANDEGLTEHYFDEDDENDTYGIDRPPDFDKMPNYGGTPFSRRRMFAVGGLVALVVTLAIFTVAFAQPL